MDIPFVEYSPDCVKREKLPLIIQLHGAGARKIYGGGISWNTGILDMPIWVFHGADDTIVPPVQPDKTVAALRARDKDVTYTRIGGVAHGVGEYAYNEDLLAWLLSKSK